MGCHETLGPLHCFEFTFRDFNLAGLWHQSDRLKHKNAIKIAKLKLSSSHLQCSEEQETGLTGVFWWGSGNSRPHGTLSSTKILNKKVITYLINQPHILIAWWLGHCRCFWWPPFHLPWLVESLKDDNQPSVKEGGGFSGSRINQTF